MLTQKIDIKNITLSLDETHHMCNGSPLYNERYIRALSFHTTTQFPNGIAPVWQQYGNDIKAFFIDTNGTKVFDTTFKQAFGFYENLAAVSDESGFYHINDSGKAAYEYRFLWCGNFVNQACVVKDKMGVYFHIDAQGKPLYMQQFSYVGDFVYNIAVAVLPNGKATHICKDGTFLHNIFFDELEPYHKNIAVAKDNKGYFHINKKGEALYQERFIKLEPFYNGKAFAIGLYGEKYIINERDYACESLQPKDTLQKIYNEYFSKLAFSFMPLQILRSVLELNILQSLQNQMDFKLDTYLKELIIKWLIKEEFITTSSYSQSCNNQPIAYNPYICYSLTQKGQAALRLKDVLLYWLDLPYLVSHKLPQSLQNNTESFSDIFNINYFDLLHKDSKQQKLFSAMSNYYASDYMSLNLALDNEIVCDIGCGSGALLDYLAIKHPKIQAIYADKTDLRTNKNGTFIELDFFKPFSIKADIFLMSRILHDYNDCQVTSILKNIADSMTNENRLYIIESLQDDTKQDIEVAFHLLNMLGSKERNLEEYCTLLSQNRLKIISVKNLDSIMSVIEVKRDNNDEHI